ncbi:hypothetical protein FRC10_004736 [Ceratobasidium sp. 414]|nr:hypothetical protein FRC10_004736 [Ceratobasidium sp. 414]
MPIYVSPLQDLQGDEPWLSRFDFYSPFVKEIHLQTTSREEGPNWHSLANAVSRRPLLPTLCKLILEVCKRRSYLSQNFGTPEDLTCFNAFVCPSLVDIRLPSGLPSWLSPNTASQLLKKITDTAPELRVLHIYVRTDAGNVDAAFRTVTQFQNLCALKCTSVMVDCEKLRLLGTLPQLESLQIVSPGDEYASDDEINVRPGDWVLPAHSFPTLRHLSAYNSPASMIVQFWRLTSLVQPLVSVGVKFQCESSSEIICNICEGSPEAQEVSLDLCDIYDPTTPTAFISHMQKLPLRRLRVVGPDIADELTPLMSPMVNLEYLDIDSTDLGIKNLILIAKHMPKLRFLSASYLDLDYWPWEMEADPVIPSPSTLCLVAGFALSERFKVWNRIRNNGTMDEYLDTIAQSLCTLWPRGVHCEIAGHKLMNGADESHVRLLNHKIMVLSRSEGLALPSSESCVVSTGFVWGFNVSAPGFVGVNFEAGYTRTAIQPILSCQTKPAPIPESIQGHQAHLHPFFFFSNLLIPNNCSLTTCVLYTDPNLIDTRVCVTHAEYTPMISLSLYDEGSSSTRMLLTPLYLYAHRKKPGEWHRRWRIDARTMARFVRANVHTTIRNHPAIHHPTHSTTTDNHRLPPWRSSADLLTWTALRRAALFNHHRVRGYPHHATLSFVKKSDLARLLTVSRVFFRCAVPHIWRQIPDAQPLLDLIPTGHCNAKQSTQSTDLQDKSWLSRFEFYAPFVKELCLQPALHEQKQEPNWHALSNVVSRHPLLPSLCKLILGVPSERYCSPRSFGSPEDLACANAFISPSLVDIRLPSEYSLWLDPDTASQLLKDIVDTAPELKVLHIYVYPNMGNVDPAFRTVTRFQNLRALKCTSVMVDCEKLRLLGTLPQLESLQIVSPGDGYVSDDEDEDPLGDWVLPARSFPMLRHLSAYELPASMVVQFWRLTSLVQLLVSVNVKFQSELSNEGIICNICKSSPQTQELSLDFSNIYYPGISTAFIDHFRKLPLQRLRMTGSYFIEELTPLIPSMTNLEYLDIGDTDLAVEDLIPIAKYMPWLRFLSASDLDLNGSGWPWEVEPNSVTPSLSMLCLVAKFRLSERFKDWSIIEGSNSMEEYLDTIAQYVPKLSNF